MAKDVGGCFKFLGRVVMALGLCGQRGHRELGTDWEQTGNDLLCGRLRGSILRAGFLNTSYLLRTAWCVPRGQRCAGGT